MDILSAIGDPNLFKPWFAGPSWASWRTFLAALFALPMDEGAAALYQRCTARTKPPTLPAREAWVIAGRRGGKSRIAALLAVFIAAFRDHRAHLAPGEVATVMVIAADRKQARVVFRYVRAFLEQVPMLRKMIVNETRETIELSNGAAIEIHTASFRSTRGYSAAAVIADECAFWPSDESGANPDVEIINALRPSLATLPGALLLAISSPWSRKGALWEAFKRFHGADGSPVLVWQSDSKTMNPTIDEQVIADAFDQDASAAAAEWGGEFRTDLESAFNRDVVTSCIIPQRFELPPSFERDGSAPCPCGEEEAATDYFAFLDAAGGSGGGDSFTAAVGHRHDGEAGARIVVDALREWRPPFSPESIVGESIELLNRYRVNEVHADRWGSEFVAERYRAGGVSFFPAEKPKSELYLELLPALNSGQVELLDHPRAIEQLCALERRTSRGGRDLIDHPPRGRDDLSNVLAGLVYTARQGRAAGDYGFTIV